MRRELDHRLVLKCLYSSGLYEPSFAIDGKNNPSVVRFRSEGSEVSRASAGRDILRPALCTGISPNFPSIDDDPPWGPRRLYIGRIVYIPSKRGQTRKPDISSSFKQETLIRLKFETKGRYRVCERFSLTQLNQNLYYEPTEALRSCV